MKTDPYTPKPMEPARAGTDSRDTRFDGLHAEAVAAVGSSAKTLRSVRERYQDAYAESMRRWLVLRDELDAANAQGSGEPGPATARQRTLRDEVDGLSAELGDHQAQLGKLEMAEHTLERTELFLEREDGTLGNVVGDGGAATDLQIRIIEAQEAERSRIARDIHDGPAQALSNAIFQVEYIERVVSDPLLVRTELRALDDSLRRELGAVRDFISQVRPPMLDKLGLEGAIMEAVRHAETQTRLAITTDLTAPTGVLGIGQRTVALRVAQEALQNVRKHSAATNVTVATRLEDDVWELEVRDDGRGFDAGSVAARGRRNFGLQFMRERAELIGARLDVRSAPDGGTIVRLAIPTGAGAGEEESR
jgi:two-component system sensor histidine kinase DegS